MSLVEQLTELVEDETLNLLVAESIAQTKRVHLLQLIHEKHTLLKRKLRDQITTEEFNTRICELLPVLKTATKQYRKANKSLNIRLKAAQSITFMGNHHE